MIIKCKSDKATDLSSFEPELKHLWLAAGGADVAANLVEYFLHVGLDPDPVAFLEVDARTLTVNDGHRYRVLNGLDDRNVVVAKLLLVVLLANGILVQQPSLIQQVELVQHIGIRPKIDIDIAAVGVRVGCEE